MDHALASLGAHTLRIACALLLLTSTAGCASPEDRWSFALSRQVYPGLGEMEGHGQGDTSWDSDGTENQIGQSVLLLPIVMLPLVADLLMLPVTGVHDLLLPVLPSPSESEEENGPLRPTPPPPRPASKATQPVMK
jgi:hypothetical protein